MSSVEELILKGLSKGLEKGAEEVSDPKWVEKLVKRGHEEVGRLPISLQPQATKGLQELEKEKASIVTGTGAAFAVVVHYVSLGKIDDAKRLWLRTKATFAEREAADNAASAATRQGVADRAAEWEKVKDMAEKWIRILGPIALSFLLAAL